MFKNSGQAVTARFKAEVNSVTQIPELATYEFASDNKKTKEKWQKAVADSRDTTRPPVAFMRNSDAHKIGHFAKRYSYVKLDEPSFRSLHYAIREPSTRIRADVLGEPHRPVCYIDGMCVKGGFIDGTCHRFSPWLTCVVGKAAVGKSVRFRLLRSCLSGNSSGLQSNDGNTAIVTVRDNAASPGGPLAAIRGQITHGDSGSTVALSYADLQTDYKGDAWSKTQPQALAALNPLFLSGSELLQTAKGQGDLQTPLVRQTWALAKARIDSSGTSPMVFDEPEACLDDETVFRLLIPQILAMKEHRQVIIFTSNANIPVIGDAEAIIVATRKGAEEVGALEYGRVEALVHDITEGGREAFIERDRRYRNCLPKA